MMFLFQHLEDFIWRSWDLLAKLEQLRERLSNPELPDQLNGAKMMLEEHTHLRRHIVNAPVENLDQEGHRILERLCGTTRHATVHAAQINGG